MSVKPELAFDVCWEVYRGAREVLESKRGISALNWKDTGKFLWKPDCRPRLNEWVADFALAGRAALAGLDWASRLVLFRTYYLGLAPYETARHFMGLSERSWLNWTDEIRRRCGEELLRRGMFPRVRRLGTGLAGRLGGDVCRIRWRGCGCWWRGNRSARSGRRGTRVEVARDGVR